jgi:hypothetical protein
VPGDSVQQSGGGVPHQGAAPRVPQHRVRQAVHQRHERVPDLFALAGLCIRDVRGGSVGVVRREEKGGRDARRDVREEMP